MSKMPVGVITHRRDVKVSAATRGTARARGGTTSRYFFCASVAISSRKRGGVTGDSTRGAPGGRRRARRRRRESAGRRRRGGRHVLRAVVEGGDEPLHRQRKNFFAKKYARRIKNKFWFVPAKKRQHAFYFCLFL